MSAPRISEDRSRPSACPPPGADLNEFIPDLNAEEITEIRRIGYIMKIRGIPAFVLSALARLRRIY